MNTPVSLPPIPDRDWYSSISVKRSTSMRCPFATVEGCPRYYQSLSLLGQAGSTKIPDAEDKRLLKYWNSTDLWPRTEEQATSTFGPEGNPSIFSNFCPEVAFERFGYFSDSLTRYPDELDMAFMHQRLSREQVPSKHPSWRWASCFPLHFTDCTLYAVLAHRAKSPPSGKAEPWWRKHLAEIIVAVVVAAATAAITKTLA